ncbi:MAG: metal-sulfur cluster assembly factor [Thermomicrobiales bacterium]
MRWNRKSQRQAEQQESAEAPHPAQTDTLLAAEPAAAPASAAVAEADLAPAFDDEELAVLGERAVEGLHEVIDPELGVNIVDLGLVYGIAFGRGEIVVTMTLTTPGCPLHASLQRAAEQALHTVLPDFPTVTINLVWSPRWHTGLISPEGRRDLGWEW